ncbi:MAG: hypothetical protein ABEK12_01180, partial [Candidatus Nanohaloarchaea archaeon]
MRYLAYRTFSGGLPLNREKLKQLSAMGVFPLLVLPLLLPVLASAISFDDPFTVVHAAHLTDYLLPMETLTVYGRILPEGLLHTFSTRSEYAETSLFLGVTVVAGAAAAVRTTFQDRYFWYAGAAVFAVLLLGIEPLHRLPIIGILRNPARYGMMVMLLLLPAFAAGIRELLTRYDDRATAITAAVGIVLVLEFLWFPFPALHWEYGAETTDYVTSLSGGEPEAALNLPQGPAGNYQDHMYVYFQTMHEQKIVS